MLPDFSHQAFQYNPPPPQVAEPALEWAVSGLTIVNNVNVVDHFSTSEFVIRGLPQTPTAPEIGLGAMGSSKRRKTPEAWRVEATTLQPPRNC